MARQRRDRQPIDRVDLKERRHIHPHHAIDLGQQVHAAGDWWPSLRAWPADSSSQPAGGLVLVDIARLQHSDAQPLQAQLAQARQIGQRDPVALGESFAAIRARQIVAQDMVRQLLRSAASPGTSHVLI